MLRLGARQAAGCVLFLPIPMALSRSDLHTSRNGVAFQTRALLRAMTVSSAALLPQSGTSVAGWVHTGGVMQATMRTRPGSALGTLAICTTPQEEIVEVGIQITNVEFESDGGAELMTNNDFYTSDGWSGGPLFQYLPGGPYPVVVGVMSGWESFSNGDLDDVNAGGQFMVALLVYGEQHWPPQ